MRTKVFLLVALFALFALFVVACAPAPTAAPTAAPPTAAPTQAPAAAPTSAPAATTAPAAAKLKVGLVTDTGGVNDKSFNQSAWAGVQKAAKDFNFDAKFIESKQPTDYEKNIDQFATEKYDVIVTVGFLMGDATAVKAKQYPNIKFAIIDNSYFPTKGVAYCDDTKKDCYADGGLTNVTSLMFQEDEVGFLAGVVAGGITKTGTVCSVSGMEIPPVQKFVAGYQNGAKYANPSVKTLNVYVPSFTDPAKGKETGQSMITQGCDVVAGFGGNTGNGGLLAAKEKGLPAIGVDVDQYLTYPEVASALVTSAAKNVDAAVYSFLKSVNDKSVKAGIATANLKNGGVGLAPYHDWDSKVPQSVKDKVAAAQKGLIDGSIKTGYGTTSAAPAATTAPAAAKLKIGLVTDTGGVNDKSFNQSAWAGVQKAAKDFNFDAKFIESKQPTDYEKNIDQFATEKYDVIVTVGFLMGDATAVKAKQYPNIKFAIIDNSYFPTKGVAYCDDTKKDCYADGGLTNVTSLMFQEDEVGFLAGVVAGGITKTGTVCSVSGMEIPPVQKFVAGYQNGAKYANPSVKTLNVYVPSFTDPAKGKETGQSMITQGCDVVAGFGGNTGNGGLLAAKEKGLPAIGVDVDQYLTYPEVASALVTSAAKNVDAAVYSFLKSVNDKSVKAGIATANLKNGGVGLAPYHDWDSKVPQSVKDKVAAAQKGLIDGSIQTGWK